MWSHLMSKIPFQFSLSTLKLISDYESKGIVKFFYTTNNENFVLNFNSRLSRGSCNRLSLIDYCTYSSNMVMLWRNVDRFMDSWILRPKCKWPELHPNTVFLLIWFFLLLFLFRRGEQRAVWNVILLDEERFK